MSEPTRTELNELIRRARVQRQRIAELTGELNALQARIRRAEHTRKRRPTKRKNQK